MENRKFVTYYGEYSLYHWIELILSEEIILPDFQRCFVWDPKRTIKLMESFDKGLFVPPIIIANFSGENNKKPVNYVLDGQQRLSAILLAFLNVFPNKFPSVEKYAIDEYNENSQMVEEEYSQNWDFNHIQDIFRNYCDREISKLKSKIQCNKMYCPIDTNLTKKYKNINDSDIQLYAKLCIGKEFLKTRYLGYSYIKSIKPNSGAERLLFGEIFKNINTSSINLSNDESRSAMYWASGDKQEFFRPSFINNVKIGQYKIDFVRYMALLSNTNNLINKKCCDVDAIKNEIAIRYARSRRFEEYIIEYVYNVSKDTNSELFGKFSDTFSNYKEDFEKLKIYMAKKPKHYQSYIEADLHLFGLFYWILFKKKSIRIDNTLNDKLLNISETEKSNSINKISNALGVIRNRIVQSINIYKQYVSELEYDNC